MLVHSTQGLKALPVWRTVAETRSPRLPVRPTYAAEHAVAIDNVDRGARLDDSLFEHVQCRLVFFFFVLVGLLCLVLLDPWQLRRTLARLLQGHRGGQPLHATHHT
eukprot:658258-Prymnesium_polylepis.1